MLPLLFERITGVVATLDAPAEIVFVNDGSRDHSLRLLQDFARGRRDVRVLSLSRNFGHQLAITAGMKAAAGEATIVLDADLQDPPELIGEMIRRWREGHDVVYAVRESRQGETHFKRASANLFYRFLTRATNIDIPLDTGDFRLVSRRAREAFLAMPESDRFVRGMFAWVGFSQCGVRFPRAARAAGETKYPLRRMLQFAVNGVLAFSDMPLRWTLYVGFAVTLLTLVATFGLVIARLTHAFYVERGWTSLVIIQLMTFGVNLVVSGAIGLYVGRIHNQVKNRPLYIIESDTRAPAERDDTPRDDVADKVKS